MSNTVYISNLNYKRDRNGLKSMFSGFGKIKNIKIIVEPKSGQSRGMAFVEMSNATEAKNAIAGLDGQIVDGRTIKANYATPLKPTSRSRMMEAKKEDNGDLDYASKMLAKKARNDARRKANPLQFKIAKKK